MLWPLAARAGPSGTRVDRGAIFWGGGGSDKSFADGALFSTTTRQWEVLPTSPLSPRRGHTAVWTGRELLVWGGGQGGGVVWADGAAYRPSSKTWTTLPPAPVSGRVGHAAVWTGHEMLVWGGESGEQPKVLYADGAAYDPGANHWLALPPAPLAARSDPAALWTGKEMIVWGGIDSNSLRAMKDGAAYDPAKRTWRALSPPPFAPRIGAGAVWTGGQMLVWGGSTGDQPVSLLDGASYDPVSDRWQPLPKAPVRASKLGATSARERTVVWTGDLLIVWGSHPGEGAGDGATYDPSQRRWVPLPASPLLGRVGHAGVWDRREMVVVGGTDQAGRYFSDGALYIPRRRGP